MTDLADMIRRAQALRDCATSTGGEPGASYQHQWEDSRMKDEAADQWKSAAKRTVFMHLRVGVADDTVYKMGAFGVRGAILGPLAGATAEVTDGTSRHTLTRVVSVVGALSKKTNAAAFVVTADGELVQHKLQGAAQVRQAQAQAIKFNALALRAGHGAG